MSRITTSHDFTKVPKDDVPRWVTIFGDQVVSILNNGINFTDNFKGALKSVTFSTGGTDATIAHGLGRVPTGYIVCGLSANMVIYYSSTPSTDVNLILQSSAAGTALLFIF